ncbi:MFS family permease [Actinoplanes lutulentus]|uniref:MFS transporter n=1 Tax=Actinoplanes lutulentus TaxID=1287878 RepID=A0A327ZAU7_9ACTN|nr:MFS transporter [Actinoplanes lutulentus]MBB2948415.1 MFS family permease [Actinoplanes lutulentus]RAK34552.1 MFS transporter [Actinoplanes lutulentus]
MPRRNAVALAVCLAAAFTTLLDQSSLTTAVPALRTGLGAGPATLQWILAGYSLTFGLALVPAGRLGDAYGRRELFAGGVALFTVAGIVAGTATSPWVVALARLAQGIGAGTVNPQVYGIIQDLFTGRDRAWALGAYSTVGGIAGVLGPVVGGLLLEAAGPDLGWRLVLLLNVPFGLVTVPLALKLLPRAQAGRARRTTLDLPGLTLLGAVTVALMLPFVTPVPSLSVVLPGLLLALYVWERRYARSGRTPVLMPALLARRGFALGTLTAMFQFGASLCTTLTLTLHLQDGLGWTPLRTAMTLLPSAFGFAVASSQSWRVVGRFGRASVVWALVGNVVAIVATVVVLHVVPDVGLGLGPGGGLGIGGLGVGLMLTQLAMGICGGLIISPNQALTLAHAPAAAAGLAGAFLQVSQRISATVATAAVTALLLHGSEAGSQVAGGGVAGSPVAGGGAAGAAAGSAAGVSGSAAGAAGSGAGGFDGVTGALAICLVMTVASAVFAALDLRTVPERARQPAG